MIGVLCIVHIHYDHDLLSCFKRHNAVDDTKSLYVPDIEFSSTISTNYFVTGKRRCRVCILIGCICFARCARRTHLPKPEVAQGGALGQGSSTGVIALPHQN